MKAGKASKEEALNLFFSYLQIFSYTSGAGAIASLLLVMLLMRFNSF